MAGEPYVRYSLHFLGGKSQNLSDVIVGCKIRSTRTRSKLPTFACWSREKREEGAKQTSFGSKATPVSNSSPFEALNLIVVSNSLSPEVDDSADNLTIESHFSVSFGERKSWYHGFKMCIAL